MGKVLRQHNILGALLTGCRHQDTTIDKVVAERIKQIGPGLRRRHGDYIYDGNRCRPENLGWRVLQNHRFAPKFLDRGEIVAKDVLSGKWDDLIEHTWHDAASAEHWYRYEKDWG